MPTCCACDRRAKVAITVLCIACDGAQHQIGRDDVEASGQPFVARRFSALAQPTSPSNRCGLAFFPD